MYFDLLKTIKKEVTIEQKKNPQQLLYPNSHLSITPMEKNFAQDNYQQLLDKAQSFRDGRRHLSEIQEQLD